MNKRYILTNSDENTVINDEEKKEAFIFRAETTGNKILASIFSDAQQWSAAEVYLENDVAEFLLSNHKQIS